MESSGLPNTPPGLPSSGDLVQQRKDAVQAAAQSGDGSFLSRFSNNPFFTAVWIELSTWKRRYMLTAGVDRDLASQVSGQV